MKLKNKKVFDVFLEKIAGKVLLRVRRLWREN